MPGNVIPAPAAQRRGRAKACTDRSLGTAENASKGPSSPAAGTPPCPYEAWIAADHVRSYRGNANAIYAPPSGDFGSRPPLAAITTYCRPSIT